MQSAKLEVFLHQWAAGSRAFGPCSSKVRLKFYQLEERKDDRVAADPLYPWKGFFSFSIEVMLTSSPISATSGLSPMCGTSSLNCSEAWKRPNGHILLFKSACCTQQNRTGLPIIRERRSNNLTQKDGYIAIAIHIECLVSYHSGW